MNKITLTVQSNGSGGWRLGINTEDSKNIFKCRKVKVFLNLSDNISIVCFTACGKPCDKNIKCIDLNSSTKKTYTKKGYDLNKKELSHWLSEKYPNIIKRKPRKLNFDIIKQGETFILNFLYEI